VLFRNLGKSIGAKALYREPGKLVIVWEVYQDKTTNIPAVFEMLHFESTLPSDTINRLRPVSFSYPHVLHKLKSLQALPDTS
jgi:hypothetical protein